MTLAFVFWFLVLLKLIFRNMAVLRPVGNPLGWGIGLSIIDFGILLVVGLKVFGSPLLGH